MMKICIDAYKNLNIEFSNNKIHLSPCCISKTKDFDSIDFENNEYLSDIRHSWNKATYHNACSACFEAEQNNSPSRRHSSNQWYLDNNCFNTNVELLRIDYWTGDLCNLRCAICSPKYSSAWKQELNIPINEKKISINKEWKNLDLQKLKFIHFNGGEPLLSKEHVAFLKAIPYKTNVHINYNTNGTVIPNEELLDLWSKFKLVQLDFSIDDMNDRFNYQRYPADWKEISENLQKFKEICPINCLFAINTSISILNQQNYPELLKWLKTNFFTNKTGDLIEFRTQLVNGILSLKNLTSNTDKVVGYLNSLDRRRGTNWQKTFPELIEIL